ncbi:MAG: autotransporter-associated beta strand repeat-containing protein [Akkermansia sp.]|nr:autotransporter-associated beta strand repeat-containing protein [Akkermansia sp.]
MVNLHATQCSWTLDGAGLNNKPVIGNITVDAGNTHGITLANVALTGSIVNNAGLTLGEGISVAAGSSAVLSGDGQLSVHRTIANAGTFNLQVSQVSLDRSNLEYLQSGIEGATVRYSYDGTTYNTDGSENGFRFQTDGRYYLVAGGQYTVTQGSQVQLGDEAYELFCDGTGIGFIYPENTRSVEYFVNSGNVVVGAAARELAETYEINGGIMVVNTGSIAGERIHFNTDAAALNIGGASHVTGTLTTTRGTTTVAGGEVDALTSTGGQVHVTGGHIGSLLFSGGSATLSGGSSESLMVGAATVEVTGMHTTGRVRMSELGASTVVIKDGGNLTLSGTNNDHSTNRSFKLAHSPYDSTLRQEGGLLNSPGATMFISWDGTGTYEAMGGVANLAGISFWGSSSNIRGKFYLGEAEGGTARVNIGANGISDISGSVQILLGNGTLGATADWRMHHNPSFTVSPVQLISTGQGTIFDTSDANYSTIGRTITVDVPFTGIGKLVKQGVGTLILNRASTHSGGTVIEAGELVAGNETALGSGKVSLAAGSLKLNTGLTIGELEYSGGALNLNGNTLNITGELAANRQLSLNSGILNIQNDAIYSGQGIIALEGSSATLCLQNAGLSHVGYDLTFNAGTALEVAGNSTIRGNVNLLADSLFKLEQAASLSLYETLEADAATLTVNGSAMLEGASTLNTSLTLADGATLDMMSLDAGAVTINGALTFGGKVEMGEHLLAAVEELTCWEPGLVLFTGLTNLVLPVAASELESDRVLASSVFSNVEDSSLYVTYHVVDNVGSLMVMSVPEPTTTSLSLAALVALAMRRRRR